MTTDAEEWQHWTEARTAAASAPHGTLALTGTHWLTEEPTPIKGVPGLWSVAGDRVRVAAEAGEGLLLSGQQVDGEVLVHPDTHPEAGRLRHGDLLLVPIEREGELALRVYDPAAEARARFAGIAVFPYAPEWSVPAVYTPYDEGDAAVTVPNADGRERPLVLSGRIAFELSGEPFTLTVGRGGPDGTQLSGVFADASSGTDTYRFRFINLPTPDEHGRTVLDLNRAYLPPCAFADEYICPFPPPGNRLPIPVRAGEKAVL